MPIVATPEVGIPLPFDTTPEEIDDFREKARAYFGTVEALMKHGLDVEVTQEDKAASHQIMASGKMPPAKNLTPGTIVNLEAILNEWDQEVLDVSRRLRNYVTNKLIVESTDPDPRQRMKALENLGKISGVGLFSERIDINVTHRTITDIESDLRKTLELFGAQVVDVEAREAPKSVAEIDLDDELGPVEAEKEQDDGPTTAD
jgi:hypothetical protein